MRVDVRVQLGNVGCLSVVVLAGAIHWALAARFGERGLLGGFFVWLVAIGGALTIVGVLSARNDRLSRAALVRAACPWCGAPLGEPAATRIIDDARRAGETALADATARGARSRYVTRYAGECPACRGRVRFDWDDRVLARDE